MENSIEQYFQKLRDTAKFDYGKLLDDLKNYDPYPVAALRIKRIHKQCIRHRHIAWADAIERKYRHLFPKSDLAMALGYAMMARKDLTPIEKDEK